MRPTRSAFRRMHALHAPLLAALLGGALPALLPAAAAALPYTVAGRTDYAVGSGPEWSTVADLNNDGHKDIVTANLLTNNVSVLLNDGTGAYLPKNDYPAGAGPFTVAAFDLNNDLFQDLVVANNTAGTISVLMGNGSGAFNSKVDHASGANCAVAAIGWFNGDWNADIVTANYGANNVSVFFGDGTGGFTSKVDFAVGANPNWVAVGDVNGDGRSDLVTANYGASSMSVLLGDGLGGFPTRTDFGVGAGPLTLTLEDLDGDNDLDVATANWNANTLSVRLGNGTGGFAPAVSYGTGTGPVTVDSGDLNLDGRMDLAVCNDQSATVSVLFGNGDGTVQPKVDFAVGAAPFAVAIGDVTNDGEPDLVSCNYGDNSISVLEGNVPGGFTVGDSLADLTALDQGGVSRTLGNDAGKWVVVDVSSVWCGPCNLVASEARQVYDTWAQAGTIAFEYVTIMVDGPHVWKSATQTNATNWANKYQIQRPVLHGNGVLWAAPRVWFDGVRTNAYPTLLIVGPDRIIRQVYAGVLTGQALVNAVAAFAGVSAPTLVPPPPPAPPPPPPAAPRAAWQAMQGGTAHASYGASSWSSGLNNYSDPVNWTSSLLATDPGVPGMSDGIVQVETQVDSLTGLEAVTIIVGSVSQTPMPTAQPWQVELSNIAWPDGTPRVLAPGSTPSVFALYQESGNTSFMQTPLQVQVSVSGNQIGLSELALGNVPDLPAGTWAFLINGFSVQHQFPVADASSPRGGTVALAAPHPNPVRGSGSTMLRWAMPRAGQARLEVVDVAGRMVRRLHAGAAAAGEHATTWDLVDESGSRVATGLYFVRLEADGLPVQSTRMVVLN